MNWLYLFFAVAAEIFGTFAMKHSNGFQKLIPSVGVVVGYAIATFLLSHVVKNLPLGTVYALWSAVGIIGSLCLDHYYFFEKFNLAQVIGLAFILCGSVILNFTLKT